MQLTGFPRKTVNGFALATAVVVTAVYLWRILVLRATPTMFYLEEGLGLLATIFGILLYLNGRQVLGMVLVAAHVAQLVVTRLVYSMSILRSDVWIFGLVLIVFIVIYLAPHRSSRT